MTTYEYLRALTGIVAQRRFKTIEVFNEPTGGRATKSYTLYKLAQDPAITSKDAMASLYSAHEGDSRHDKAFTNLIDRTVNRLENLLLLTDPSSSLGDKTFRSQLQAVRSLVIGMYLAQSGLADGAHFHLRKGIRHRDIIPAEWQGLCISALRHLVLYHSQFGSRSKAMVYANELEKCLKAVHMEAMLRSQHDTLYATVRASNSRSQEVRIKWHTFLQSCSRVHQHHRVPWFRVSVSRMRLTAYQVIGDFEAMLGELKSSPLPRAEVDLMTAVTSLELGLLTDAKKHALSARTVYKPGSSNWLTCTDVAIRSQMLSGHIEHATELVADIRRYPRLYSQVNELDAWLGMVEAYCRSFQQLLSHPTPRRGRPTKQYQHFKSQLRETSTTRQTYISLSVWQLIDARAQQDEDLFEQTIGNMLRYVRRRQDLRTKHRFGVFVEFVHKHRFTRPSTRELRQLKLTLQSFSTVYSGGEIISYETLGEMLTAR
jgi:hypothetical protein